MNQETSRPTGRPRLSLRAEFVLVALPTLTVLIVFAAVDALSRQRLLFASLWLLRRSRHRAQVAA
jgi:hypothetical protein